MWNAFKTLAMLMCFPKRSHLASCVVCGRFRERSEMTHDPARDYWFCEEDDVYLAYDPQTFWHNA